MAKANDYQSLSLELEEILAKLQQSDVRVDEAVTLYEQGLAIIAKLEKHLDEAENKIKSLKLAASKATKEEK